MNKQEDFDESKLTENPFINQLQIPVTRVTSRGSYTYDADDGMYNRSTFYLENTKKTTMYHYDSSKSIILGLSHQALKLYMWIAFTIKPNKDYIRLNQQLYMKKIGITARNTYKKAVEELIRYNFIREIDGLKTVFYINPSIFFSGSRVNKYPKNVVVKNNLER